MIEGFVCLPDEEKGASLWVGPTSRALIKAARVVSKAFYSHVAWNTRSQAVMVKKIANKVEFDQTLQDAGNKLVVVDFTATWCGPCRMIAPVFEKLANQNPGVVFVKVDVDEASDVSESCGISSMPTFHFYKNGQKIKEFSGADASKLAQVVAELR